MLDFFLFFTATTAFTCHVYCRFKFILINTSHLPVTLISIQLQMKDFQGFLVTFERS